MFGGWLLWHRVPAEHCLTPDIKRHPTDPWSVVLPRFPWLMLALLLLPHRTAGVVKHVRHVRVFVTTAIISMWAYVWMLIVYLWWTPHEVGS